MRLNSVWLVGLLACLALTREVVRCSWAYNETVAVGLADGNCVEAVVSFNQAASAADSLFLLPPLARSLFDSLNVSRLSLTVAQGLRVQDPRSSHRRIWPTGATAYVELASDPGAVARETSFLQELSAVLSSLSCVPQASWQSAWTPLHPRQSSSLFFDREISAAPSFPIPSRGFLAQAADEPACVEHLLRWQALLPCGLRAGAAKLLPALLRPSQHRGLSMELSAGPSGARVDVTASFVLGREQAEELLRARNQESAHLECMGSRVRWDLDVEAAAERARALEHLAEESEVEHLQRLIEGEDRREGGASGSGDGEHEGQEAQTPSGAAPPSLRLHRHVETHNQKQAWDGRCVLRADMEASAASGEGYHLLHLATSFPEFVSIERLDVVFDGQRLQRGDPRLLSAHVHEKGSPVARGGRDAKVSTAEVTLAWHATQRLAASRNELRVDLMAYFTVPVHSIFDLPPDAARGALIPPAMASWVRPSHDRESSPVLRACTPPAVVPIPMADPAMPFNVMCFAGTLLALSILGCLVPVLREAATLEGGATLETAATDPSEVLRAKLRRVLAVLLVAVVVGLYLDAGAREAVLDALPAELAHHLWTPGARQPPGLTGQLQQPSPT